MLHKSSSFKLKRPPLMERKNIEKKNIVNLSHFFLFEAVDDSEGEFDHSHNHNSMMMMGYGDEDDDDDDAESCSYDTWDSTSHVNDVCRGRYRTNNNHNNNIIVNDDDDDDDENVAYMRDDDDDHKSTSEVVSTANSHNSRKSCVDSNVGKKLSENDRNRLFWETCLAS
ncbi:hypothetical protein RND81_04G077700 [Saponaria officinalis]|uniref:Uncharacterized protein n=1 Tax=Saponaria officinalis TaxID=3572 RepID=A0AAW1LJV5_SAPOF